MYTYDTLTICRINYHYIRWNRMIIDMFILLIIVFFASFLQASTGYGFSIIGTPFLLMIYPAHEAIQINIILSICLSLFMIQKIKSEYDRELVVKLMIGSVAGMIGGIFVYLYFDVQWLKLAVGILILLLTIFLVCNFRMRRTNKRDIVVGGLSGLLTTSIGVPGPPLLLYFSGASIDQFTLRSTTLIFYLFVYSGSLVMQIVFGSTSTFIWLHSLIAIPSLIVGVFLGQMFIQWVSQQTFRLVTYVILTLSGAYLLVTSF